MSSARSYLDAELLGNFTAQVLDSCVSADFGITLTRLVEALVPGAVISLDEIHAPTGTYQLAHTLPDESIVRQAVGRLTEVFGQSPIHQHMEADGPEQVLDLRELAPTTVLKRTDFYQDVLRPLSIEHQVAVRLDRSGWSCTLTLNRDRAFEPELKAFLQHAAPALIAAHRVACEVRRLRSLVADREKEVFPSVVSLTPREWEVLTWMREGKRNSEIAVILQRSVRTVEKHVESILRKTGAETRTAACRCITGKGAPT